MQKTLTIMVSGVEQAKATVGVLIDRSKWFEFTPLPDDCYEIAYKDEAGTEDLVGHHGSCDAMVGQDCTCWHGLGRRA